MELPAIPPGCQNTAAKWLVMRRCAVLATVATFNLRRNYVCQVSRMATQRSVRLASIPPREFLRQGFLE